MTAALLLAVALTPTAPVPLSLRADRERLEAHWADLGSYDPVKRTAAAFALADHPAAVPFLKEKAPPVKATAADIRGWLADLNGEDEGTWKPAFEKLRYFHPQIELAPAEQLDQVTTDFGRRSLASLWWGEPIDRKPDYAFNTLKIDGHDSFCFTQHYRDRTGRESVSDHNGTLFGVAHSAPDVWRRAALAAVVLRRIDTPAASAALLKLASGHPDALPTRTANSVIRARFALPSPFPDTSWAKLLDFDPIQTTRWAFELADHPERVRALKAKLPPIKATSDEVTTWLKALNSDKADVWKPAFEKLLYFRPSLVLSLDEQDELMTNDHGRSAFYAVNAWHVSSTESFTVYSECVLMSDGRGGCYCLTMPQPGGGGQQALPMWSGPLISMTPLHWQRARLAILALQRANTPAAKAVLRQLADGHPDILPTKEAKAALR